MIMDKSVTNYIYENNTFSIIMPDFNIFVIVTIPLIRGHLVSELERKYGKRKK
jgi:hypothetical protein